MYTPSQIVGWAKIAQPLALMGEAKSLKDSDRDLHIKIYECRKSVEWMIAQAPSPTVDQNQILFKMANYLYSLLGVYGVLAQSYGVCTAPRIVIDPVSQSVSSGASVTLSVAASGTSPLTYQWYKDGVAIGGATSSSYTFTALAGSYTCTVSNGCGSATSNAAVISVSSAPVSYWIALDTDPYDTINGGSDPYVYTNSVTFTSGAAITYPVSFSDANKYFIFKIPKGEPTKTAYSIPPLDSGSIPNPAMRAPITSLPGYDYILSRGTVALASGSTITLS